MSEIEEAAAAPLRRRHEAPAVVQSAELGLHPVRPDGEIHSMLLKIMLGKALIKCNPLFFYVQHHQLPKLHLYLLYGLYPPPYFSMMINSIGDSIPDSSLHNAVAVLYEPPLRLPPRLGGRRVGPEALGHRRQAGPHAGLHSVLVDLLNVHITLILCFL